MSVSFDLQAQVNANYVFSQSMGTYTPLGNSATVVLAATNPDPGSSPETAPMDDALIPNINLPFPFTFNGVVYNSIDASTNGWIGFGGPGTNSIGTAISSLTGHNGVIVPFGGDLVGVTRAAGDITSGSNVITNVSTTSYARVGATFMSGSSFPAGTTITAATANSITVSNNATATGTAATLYWTTGAIKTELSGTAPNQKFTIEFSGMSAYAVQNNNVNFQIVLYEGGGIAAAQKIEIIYGTVARASGTTTVQVGLRGNATSDYTNRTTTSNWGATSTGTSNSASCTWSATSFPAAGLTYSWTIPTCIQATGLMTTNITSTSADISWSQTGSALQWEIEYAAGTTFSLGSGIRSTEVSPLKYLTSLASNTQYSYFVRTICGPNDTSVWTSRNTFTTLCAPLLPPLTESFATYLPGCWSEQVGLLSFSSDSLTGTTSSWFGNSWLNTAANGQAASINLYDIGKKDWLISPSIDLGTGSTAYRVNFDVAFVNYAGTTPAALGGDDSLVIVVSTDNGLTWNLGNALRTWTATNSLLPGGKQNIILPLTGYVNTVKIGFYGTEGVVNNAPDVDVMVDNFKVEVMPSCSEPTDLAATSVTSSSADINWTQYGTSSQWQIEYGVGTTYALGTGTRLTTTSNPYTITLPSSGPGATYSLFIRAICGPNDTSAWSYRLPVTLLPNCPAPTSLTSSSITTTSADISWIPGGNETAWEIEYTSGTSLPPPGMGTKIYTTTYPYTLILPYSSIGGSYSVMVRGICGIGDTSAQTTRHQFQQPAGCPAPTALTSSSITTTSADISWTPGGNEAAWQISYATGTTAAAGSGTIVYTTVYPHNLVNLASGTSYSVFVRAICGAGDTSAWSTRRTFNTLSANDLPASAISIPLNTGCTAATTYSNVGGTVTAGEPGVSCRATPATSGASVWFKFLAPSSGFVKVSTDATGTMDTKLGLFTTANPADPTDLASFSIIGCDDDNGVITGAASILYAAELVPGATYYIAVDHYAGNGATGSFCISIDSMTQNMLSPSGACLQSGNTSSVREDYTSWISMVDGQGRLVALARRNTSGGAASYSSNIPSLTVNTGASRLSGSEYYLNRNFHFANAFTTAPASYDIKLFFLNSELAALTSVNPSATLPNLTASRTPGTCASNYTANSAATSHIPTSNGSSSGISWIEINTATLGNFYISGSIPLRIELGDINATNIGTANRIEWNTLSENIGDQFELQRSVSGQLFASLDKRSASGEAGHYTYVDEQAIPGINYYRLKMIESSGQVSYSKTVTANVAIKGFVVNAFPNPFTDKLTITVSGKQGDNPVIQLADLTGKVLRIIKTSGTETTIDLSTLSDGVYLVTYADSDHVQTVKITKE